MVPEVSMAERWELHLHLMQIYGVILDHPEIHQD